MSVPFGDPRGRCFSCDEPCVEDVNAENIDGDLFCNDCLEAEREVILPFSFKNVVMIAAHAGRPLD